jgi:hypothetical protein
MGTLLFKTLAPFLLTVVLLTSGQYLAIGQSYSSYAWTKKAKWAVVSNHFHEGLLSVLKGKLAEPILFRKWLSFMDT